jgi:hypothetical protein
MLLMATSPFVFAVHPSAAAENNRGAQPAAMCALATASTAATRHSLDHWARQKTLTDVMEAFSQASVRARS